MMTAAQAESLFMKECCLFGKENGVTADWAKKYVGPSGILKVIDDCKQHVDWEFFSFGGKCAVICLYLSGFQHAVTVANTMEITGKIPEIKNIKIIEDVPKEKLVEFPAKSKGRKKAAAGGGADA